MSRDPLVIVGAGHGAGQLVASLAQEGYTGPVTLIGDEPCLPYQRPPLSKRFLAGELDLDRLYIKPAAFYEAQGTQLILGRRVIAIDRAARCVRLEDGTRLAYATLVLATGSRARAVAIPGCDLGNVFSLRNIADVERIRAAFAPGKTLVVVGGGYIGLELAAVAVKAGLRVTVLEQASRLMARGVGPVVSAFYARLHREEGVDIRTGVAVHGLEGTGDVAEVICSDGRCAADLVVIGAGAEPNVELAREAGLAVDNGIRVDAACRTADPLVLAIGDCTNQHHALLGHDLRLESVQNAVDQARTAAAAICGKPLPPPQVPWFWSDQYDVKLQIAGLAAGATAAIVRGMPHEGRSFAVHYLQDGVPIAVDAINRPAEYMMAKALIGQRARVDPARLADERNAVRDCRV